jgi:hypothetical protein
MRSSEVISSADSSSSGRMFSFSDPAHERRFQLAYGAAGSLLDVNACAMGTLLLLASFVKDWLHPAATTAAATSRFIMLCLMATSVLAYLVLGPERYVTALRIPYTSASRILLAAGLGISGRLKHQRLLLFHLALCLSRHQASAFWIGGVACWLVAALVDAADPFGTCGQSLPCLLDAIQRFVTGPADIAAAGGVAGRIVQALSSCCGLQHLAGVVLPGLLLCYIEMRARRAWLALEQRARQQQRWAEASSAQQTPSAATNTPAASDAPALAAVAAAAASSSAGVVHKGITDDVTQQQQQQQDAPAAASSSSTASNNQLQQPQASRAQRRAARAAAALGQAGAPLAAAAQRRLASCNMLYNSPVKSKVVAFKLRHPPTADGAGKRCMCCVCVHVATPAALNIFKVQGVMFKLLRFPRSANSALAAPRRQPRAVQMATADPLDSIVYRKSRMPAVLTAH